MIATPECRTIETDSQNNNNKTKDKIIMAVQSRVAAVTGANKGIGLAIGE
jgi:hypothetical protein